jgi:hypothetical protein
MPGPLNTWEQNHDVDDGTSRRQPSNTPGSTEQRSPSAWARGEAVYEAYTRALILAPTAVFHKTGYALGGVLKGLLPGLQQAVVVLGATTALGAVAGGVIGFFFGGAGAAPGAVLGGELGFDIGTAALTWLGVGFLAVAITMGLGELWATVSSGIKQAWAAPEYPEREYPHQIEQAAQDLADGVGILMLLILQAIVATVLKRVAVESAGAALATGRSIGTLGSEAAADEAVAAMISRLRSTKLGSEFADWVKENWPQLRDDPRLRFRTSAAGNAEVKAPSFGQFRTDGANEVRVVSVPDSLPDVPETPNQILSAEEANKPHLAAGRRAPYQPGTEVGEVELDEPRKFARVHTTNKVGSWLMRPEDIEGLTAEQIKDKFALPTEPTNISDVNVPEGSLLRYGFAGSQPGWGAGGGVQYELMNRIDEEAFTNTKPLGGGSQ